MDATSRVVEKVIMVDELAVAVICDVAGRRAVIPRSAVLPGSEIRKPGDRGRLVVPRWVAFDLGLDAGSTDGAA